MGGSHTIGTITMTPFIILTILFSVAAVEEGESLHYKCPLMDINFNGHDLEMIPSISTWEECGHICNLFPECKFWSWNYPHTAGYQNCYLKSSDAGLISNAGVISGLKGCAA